MNAQDAPSTLLARAERFNDLLTQNLHQLRKEEHSLAESVPKITIEVEQLKKVRESLVSSLQERVTDVLSRESKRLEERLSHSFLETTAQGGKSQQDAVQESLKLYEEELTLIKSSFEDYLDGEKQSFKIFAENYHKEIGKTFKKYAAEAEQFKQDMVGVVSSMKKLMNLQKHRLTRKGLLLCGVFCAASFLTGAGLFYFFPQHVYYPDRNISKNIIMGKAARENFTRFSAKDQDILLEEVRKYMLQK